MIKLGQITIKLTPFTRNVIQVWSDGDGTNKDKTENGYAYVKKQCMHCVDPNCVAVCPVQALTKDPKTGIVKYDPDICTGCRYCMVGVHLMYQNTITTIHSVKSASVNSVTKKALNA